MEIFEKHKIKFDGEIKIMSKIMTVSSVLGNSQKLDGGAMFGNAPKAMWEKWIVPDEFNRIPLATRGMLIETQNLKILCEVGIGNFFESSLAERFGIVDGDSHVLLNSLNMLGVDHCDIDVVILSHLHFDHAGGLLPSYNEIQNGNHSLLFPNAKYVVSKDAFARSENPHPRDRASYIDGLADKLVKSERLILVDGKTIPGVLEDQIELIYTNGHTPGQLHVLFKGESEKIFFCGDTIPGTPWLHAPITMGYDRFAELVIDEKKSILARAVNEKWLMFYTHDSQYAASYCLLGEKGKYHAGEKFNELFKLRL